MGALSSDQIHAEQLLRELTTARAFFAHGDLADARLACSRSFVLLGAVYAALDASGCPEITRRLQAIYDECFRRLGRACAGELDAIDGTVALLRPVIAALSSTKIRAAAPVIPEDDDEDRSRKPS